MYLRCTRNAAEGGQPSVKINAHTKGAHGLQMDGVRGGEVTTLILAAVLADSESATSGSV